MKRLLLLTLTAAVILTSGNTASAGTIRVPGDYSTIQGALDHAGSGDVVMVDPGTYRENIVMPATRVTLQSTDPTDPAVVAATIINGDTDANDVGDGIVIACGDSTNDGSVINGFTITKGKGKWGGGMSISYCSLTVSRCVFIDNQANYGAGIWIGYSSAPSITHCTFEGNQAALHGGAIVNKNSANSIITGCTFRNNTAVNHGGGIANENSTPTLTDSSFCGNTPNTLSGSLSDNSGDNVIYTDCGGTTEVDELIVGLSLPRHFTTVQAAINFTSDGHTVVVKPGRYTGNVNLRGKGITLRSTDPRDPVVITSTIIDGCDAGSVITCNSGEDGDTVVNGLLITNGKADDGGGMYNGSSSSPTVMNCVFAGNQAADHGGGMYNDNSDPNVINCTFISNRTTAWGGGLSNDTSSPAVTGCSFIENTADVGGGGMYNWDSSLIVTDCSFSHNTGGDYGAGMYNYSSSLVVTGCSFVGNETPGSGGGMYITHASWFVIRDCSFLSNTSSTGGGIGICSCNPTITNCSFVTNSAAGTGGGIFVMMVGEPVLENNCFYSNSTPVISGDYVDNGGNNFEFCPLVQPERPKGDLDGDGDVDFADFAIMAVNWLAGTE